MSMTNEQAIAELSRQVNTPGSKLNKNEFARSLWRQSGIGLSAKQLPWVHKLIAPDPTPQPGFPRIPEIFKLAGERLKWPKITVTTWHGEEIDVIRFGRYGEKSRYHGQVKIESDGYYDERTYYGRIDHAGTFHPTRDSHPALAEILTSLNTSLEDFAYQQGAATGNCIFCSNPLSDERSITAGYGPTCAKNYQLSWGNTQRGEQNE